MAGELTVPYVLWVSRDADVMNYDLGMTRHGYFHEPACCENNKPTRSHVYSNAPRETMKMRLVFDVSICNIFQDRPRLLQESGGTGCGARTHIKHIA